MYTINLNILFEDKEPFIQINYYIDILTSHCEIINPHYESELKTTHMK